MSFQCRATWGWILEHWSFELSCFLLFSFFSSTGCVWGCALSACSFDVSVAFRFPAISMEFRAQEQAQPTRTIETRCVVFRQVFYSKQSLLVCFSMGVWWRFPGILGMMTMVSGRYSSLTNTRILTDGSKWTWCRGRSARILCMIPTCQSCQGVLGWY